MRRGAVDRTAATHIRVSWSYVVRLLLPCQELPLADRACARRWRDASISALQLPPREYRLYHANRTPAIPSTTPEITNTTHNGACHLLGRAPPIHQLGCAPQARHSLEFGHWQLRSSDCGMPCLEKRGRSNAFSRSTKRNIPRPPSLPSASASATPTDPQSLSHTLVSATRYAWTPRDRAATDK